MALSGGTPPRGSSGPVPSSGKPGGLSGGTPPRNPVAKPVKASGKKPPLSGSKPPSVRKPIKAVKIKRSGGNPPRGAGPARSK
jgi:hypothetical protein